MSTLFLCRKDVRRLLNMADVIESVERAFRQWAQGTASMPPKAYLVVEKGDFRAMPAALPGSAGVKWANVHTQNRGVGLPTVMAMLLYNDPETGYPLAVMDATEITSFRTGATAAIASKHLARRDSRTLGIVGAGCQAYTQLAAHAELFDLSLIKVYDPFEEAVARFVTAFPQSPVQACSLEDTVASDIVCTLTPAREPFVKREWVKPGTHINAVGADAAGKEELDPSILTDAIVIVDDLRQASSGGEINVPVRKGLFDVKAVRATLSDLVSGAKPGREDDRAITVFDSTGLAIEDIAVADLVYRKAAREGGFVSLDFVEG